MAILNVSDFLLAPGIEDVAYNVCANILAKSAVGTLPLIEQVVVYYNCPSPHISTIEVWYSLAK